MKPVKILVKKIGTNPGGAGLTPLEGLIPFENGDKPQVKFRGKSVQELAFFQRIIP
ncbi:MAG: hypothetical protein JXL20_06665 [Deltaproteobacteria bacterium]|nr:hypothetical protein [Deltaproteobacteria bacterium]